MSSQVITIKNQTFTIIKPKISDLYELRHAEAEDMTIGGDCHCGYFKTQEEALEEIIGHIHSQIRGEIPGSTITNFA